MRLRFAAVILAGGRSTRMGGGSKCLLPIRGVPIIERIIESVGDQVECLFLNVPPDGGGLEQLNLPMVTDLPGLPSGPLAGIYSSLKWLHAREQGSFTHLITFPSDVPVFPNDLLRELKQRAAQATDSIAVCYQGSQIQPLFAAWPLALIPVIEYALQREIAGPRPLLEQRPHLRVAYPGRHGLDFFNVNTPEQLAELEACMAETQQI